MNIESQLLVTALRDEAAALRQSGYGDIASALSNVAARFVKLDREYYERMIKEHNALFNDAHGAAGQD